MRVCINAKQVFGVGDSIVMIELTRDDFEYIKEKFEAGDVQEPSVVRTTFFSSDLKFTEEHKKNLKEQTKKALYLDDMYGDLDLDEVFGLKDQILEIIENRPEKTGQEGDNGNG